VVETWTLVFLCIAPTLCDPTASTLRQSFETEQECQQAGLGILANAPQGMQGRTIVCLKGISLPPRSEDQR
jgi:hypothetical protein